MQCHSCVCILGHAEPQNWFNPGVRNACLFQYISLKYLFGTVTIYFDIFFVEKYKIEYHQTKNKNKKKKPTLVFRYFGSVGKGQTNIFFFFF